MAEIRKTISDLIMEYFRMHPKKDLKHGPVVDWVEEQYLKLYKNPEILGVEFGDCIRRGSL